MATHISSVVCLFLSFDYFPNEFLSLLMYSSFLVFLLLLIFYRYCNSPLFFFAISLFVFKLFDVPITMYVATLLSPSFLI